MGRRKKKSLSMRRKKLKQRILIRRKMGKPVFFTLTGCQKKLRGLSNQYNYKSNMHGLLFIGTKFFNVKYQASIMTECNFRDSFLTGVDFFNSNMKGVSFKNATLKNVVFYNCNLKGANFSGAKFEQVSFICTNTACANNLDLSNDGVKIYTTYHSIQLPENVERDLLSLSSNPLIFSAKVLHVNKNKLNHWALQLIQEQFGLDGIEFLAKQLGQKENCNNLYTVFSYLSLLEKVRVK